MKSYLAYRWKNFIIKIFKEIVTVLRGYVHNYDSAIKMLDGTFQVPLSEKIYFGGKANMLFAARVP